tara:strand:+ start:4976 stop:5701 length:726 start_codon:yes stop_codon:yes gene_type:complete
MTAKTYAHYVQAAFDLCIEGSFPTKAAAKDARQYLNRAYGVLRADLNYAALEANGLSFWDVPLDLHQIRSKHTPILTVAIGFEDADRVRFLADQLDKVKAMPVIKPTSKPKVAAQPTGNQATHRGTCQICGAAHKVSKRTGRIAKHGYRHARNGHSFGWFEGECDGSGRLPFEVDCVLLGRHIDQLEQQLDQLRQSDDPVYKHWSGKRFRRAGLIMQTERAIEEQKKRLEGWQQTDLMPII